MSQFNYTQLPPDGTGKKVASINTIEIVFTYLGGDTFSVGDAIRCATATRKFEGNIIKIKSTEIYVVLDRSLATPLQSGDILIVDGVNIATFISLAEDMRTQTVVLAGGNSTLNTVSISDAGAIKTTTQGGDFAFDAFGKLMTSESSVIREYQPVDDELPDLFTDTLVNGGTVTWNGTRHVVELKTGTTIGAKAFRRSNLYHKYQTGIATTVLFSASMDTAGKDGVTKRLGLFDDDDGLYFGVHGTGDSTVGCVVRSSVSGSVVETHVHQPEWNVDTMDGSGTASNISRILLDMTKTQVMFIDFQWLGAGRVRFGFVIDGNYIVVHQFNHANNLSVPYMRTGTLPLSFEVENTGAPASDNTLSIISSIVKCEGEFTPKETLFGGSLPVLTINDDTNYIPLASFRAKELLPSGHENRTVVLPTVVTIAELTTIGKPWLLELVKNDTLTGGTDYVDAFPESAIEMSADKTGSANGTVLLSWTVTGDEHIDVINLFNFQNELVIREADITEVPRHYTLRAKNYDATSMDIVMSFNWQEIR